MDNSSGKLGEDEVVRFLKQNGYTIVKRNYHSRFGEIDIIAQNDQYIVFVEVKTRQKGSLVHPFEAITPAKRRKIILTANEYLARYHTSLQPRFDAAALITQNGTVIETEYLENAFIS